jgi:hypothetical protein
MCTRALTFNNSSFLPSVRIYGFRMIFRINSINQLIFEAEKCCVLFEVWTAFLIIVFRLVFLKLRPVKHRWIAAVLEDKALQKLYQH